MGVAGSCLVLVCLGCKSLLYGGEGMRWYVRTVREMNDVLRGGKAVYADLADGQVVRIHRARRVKGVLQVRCLSDGAWVCPIAVWWG